LVCDGQKGPSEDDRRLLDIFEEKKIPFVTVYNKADLVTSREEGLFYISAVTGEGVEELKNTLARIAPEKTNKIKIVDSFVNMLQGKVSFSEMSGPIGIVSEIGTAVGETRSHGWEGFQNLMFLTILLTINLGVFNLLPLPALDGGRILFVLIEMIRRKPVPVEKEAIVHFIGFAILIAFSIFIAFKDVFTMF